MSRPWMSLYVADYLADTEHLNAAESGAYLHLIMHYWRRGSLPDDDARLSRIAKMTASEWTSARPIIQAFFFDGWCHKRVDKELAEAEHLSDINSTNGKKGAAARRLAREAAEAERLASEAAAIVQRSLSETASETSASSQPSPSQPPSQPSSREQSTSLREEARAREGDQSELKKKPARMPADWKLTPADIAFAKGIGLTDTEIARDEGKIRAHYAAKPEPHGLSLDWSATAQKWLLGTAERLGRQPRTESPPRTEKVRVEQGTPQWDAWQTHLRKTTGKGSSCVNFGWTFPSQWPPGHAPPPSPAAAETMAVS